MRANILLESDNIQLRITNIHILILQWKLQHYLKAVQVLEYASQNSSDFEQKQLQVKKC